MDTTRPAVGALALAAQQAGLLRGALASGFLTHVGDGVGVAELAEVTGLDPDRVRAVGVALVGTGVLESDAPDRYRLSGSGSALLGDDRGAQYANQLRNAAVRERLFEQVFTPEGPDRFADLSDDDRAAIAAGSSLVASSATARTSLAESIEQAPVFAEALAAGDVRGLELGCGVGGHVLTLLQMYPRLTAVAVDTAADLLEKASAEAAAVGVADRIRFVAEDAVVFTDPEPFDLIFWSQLFFPAASRAKTLANAYRLLRPGGLLVMPVRPDVAAGNPAAALGALLLTAWDVPPVTADELCAELADAGFASPTGYGPLRTTVVAHRP